MRPDLVAKQHRYQGRVFWVVKEPVGLRYFRFQEEEYAVLKMLDGDASLESVKQRFEAEFPPHKITFQDLQQFIGTLHRSGLVISDAPGQGMQLKKRRDERDWQELKSKLSNVLSLRFKGIDPERLLSAIYPFTRWFFSKTAVLLFLMVGLAALMLVLVQFDVFRSRLPAFDQFFGPRNWLWLGATLAITKVMHEFGHGLLCKHFGGECHEMGVMFLVLTPCLYCNVSDSWMLPNKWQRAAIGAGGMYVELVLATFATFIWWFSSEGLLNFLALRVMFICSVSTVLFNGNPLLRFDGYYILSDILEIPNLRQKATKILQQYAAEWCLGLEMPEDPFLPQRNQILFAMYTLAAVAYRWFVFFSILFFLNKVFEPYGLKILGRVLAVAGLFGLVVQPLWALGKFFYIPGRIDQVKWPRVAITAGVVAGALAFVALFPFPHYVRCGVQLQAASTTSESVYVEVPGTLAKIAVKPGQQVDQGAVLAELENRDIEIQLKKLQADHDNYAKELESKRRVGSRDPSAFEAIETLVAAERSTREQVQEKQKQLASLTLRAPLGGYIIAPPPKRRAPSSTDQLQGWSGTPLEDKNLGAQLETSDFFCQIGNPGELEAVLAIDEGDIEYVKEGQNVELLFDAEPWQKINGTLYELSRREMRAAPPSLSNQAGGEVATRKDDQGVDRPLNATYQAKVAVANAEQKLRIGFRGRAKIRAGNQTLAQRLYRYLARTFHFEI